NDDASANGEEIPLFSVLRDTLGDAKPENDRLRYVWLMTYTKPSFWQKAAGFVPFLYTRTTNKGQAGNDPPPVLADVRRSNRALWGQIFWAAFCKIVLSEAGIGVKASASQYHQNLQDRRRTAVASAVTLLSAYESIEGEKLLTDQEMRDIQSRLWLTDKPMGWHMQDENLDKFYAKKVSDERNTRGHNWELLRQYCEAQGLYFDPLDLPDETARHAIVWIDAGELAANKERKFDGRFLNIKDPWNDDRLRDWTGFTQSMWFDGDHRRVDAATPGAEPHTMIPLAIYGLDHPKVPMILVDFRDAGNPHRREITKRVLSDITGNVLSVSQFGNLPYFVAYHIYGFVAGRRGMDVNQPSRMRSYAQLKMLLALDGSMDTELKDQIAKRIERVAMNPLENDLDAELEIARTQYKNLMDYARRPDGLPAKIERDRREEAVEIAHSYKEQLLLRTAHYLSLGLYTHREDPSSDIVAKVDVARQLDYHQRYLIELAERSVDPEIDADMTRLKKALDFVASHGIEAMDKTARALGKIFMKSDDDQLRTLCLAGLYRIDSSVAKSELLAIYADKRLADNWRVMSARYLRRALDERQRMSKADAVAVAAMGTN
ncbi:MAG: hypothetical protein JO314_13450, partial [Acidobacteria bacterium]|nr:hypothetical protein [Acidobacteriota bacterium]